MHLHKDFPPRRSRACAAGACLLGALAPALALAQTTVSEGTVLLIESDIAFSATVNNSPRPSGQLTMDGGSLRISDGATGQAVNVAMLDAILRRGAFNNSYTQTGMSRLDFLGLTTVTGGVFGPAYPADGMYIRASAFDTQGLIATNHNLLEQTGNGQLVTQGPVQFNNTGTFDIGNDLGFRAGDFTASGIKPFFNTGLFRKTGGSGTSTIEAVFYQDGGSVESRTGSLAFTSGGSHKNASFAANPLGSNPTGQILLGGAQSFDGSVTTQSGGIIGLASGATLDVAGNWEQRGLFSNAGQIAISDSGTLVNSGFFVPGGGQIVGVAGAAGGGTIVNSATGVFSSTIAPLADSFGGEIGRLDVVNRGTFTVSATQSVLVKNFVNESGTVTVNGLVENRDGTFQLLGGVLWGTGTINGDGISVGGGPGVAVFNPGSSPGTMTIEGPFSLLPGGVLELEVVRDPLSGLILHDQVVAQSFSLDGQVSFLVGAGVTEADVLGLQFLDCGGSCGMQFGGNFSYDFPGRPGSTLDLRAEGIFITALAPVPEPQALAMMLAGMGMLTIVLRRRPIRAG